MDDNRLIVIESNGKNIVIEMKAILYLNHFCECIQSGDQLEQRKNNMDTKHITSAIHNVLPLVFFLLL